MIHDHHMSDIQSERRDSTALITLNNPEAFNALTPTMTSGLVSALREAAADRTCRTIVLTGRGERAFCAGVDVKSVAQRDADAGTRTGSSADPIEAQFQNLHHELAAIIRTIHTLPVPVIAAVSAPRGSSSAWPKSCPPAVSNIFSPSGSVSGQDQPSPSNVIVRTSVSGLRHAAGSPPVSVSLERP